MKIKKYKPYNFRGYLTGYSFGKINFVKLTSLRTNKVKYKILFKLPLMFIGLESLKKNEKINKYRINKYWTYDLNKYVEGYKYFGISFVKISLFQAKNKYRIYFKLPTDSGGCHTLPPVAWANGEFDAFLNEIRNK